MTRGDREKLQKLVLQATREWFKLMTDVPLSYYIAEWLLLNNLTFVVHGRWVVENEESIRCSECCFNRASIKMPLDYCPNCGADMRERKDND